MKHFEDLKGKILVSAEVINGKYGEDRLVFKTSDGWKMDLFHEQDCCEGVWIEDIAGDLNDLIGSPILMAEEAENEDPNACESGTWTFYKLATMSGYVTIRWYGESNGYYSESVDTVCERLEE